MGKPVQAALFQDAKSPARKSPRGANIFKLYLREKQRASQAQICCFSPARYRLARRLERRMEGARYYVLLLRPGKLYKVYRIAGNAYGKLRIFFRMLHSI